MKAWQFVDTFEPMEKVDLPVPTPAAGEVLIDVKAAGLCHSDVGLMDDEGWKALLAYRPITPGHEVAGVIAELGEGVTDWAVGDRVCVCPTTEAGAPGYSMNGGFQPHMTMPTVALVRIPDNVPFTQAAAATDAGMTSYHAMFAKGGVTAGTKVGVIGFGGLGQFGARCAVLAGAEVYVAEVNEAAWENAHAAGVQDVKKSITEFKDIGLDVIVDYAGFGQTTTDATETVRLGGRVVLVGMGKLEFTLSTMAIITGQVELVGSNGGTKEDVVGVMEYLASGKLTPKITEIRWDEIPHGLGMLKRHEVIGRLAAVYE